MPDRRFGWIVGAWLLAGPGLLMPVHFASVGATTLAQTPTAPALLEASAAATEGVQTMRFVMEAHVEQPGAPAGTGTSPSLSGWGAFQAPDRLQMASQVGASGQLVEGIVIGQAWGRLGDGPWRPGGPGPGLAGGPPTPRALAGLLRDLPPYLQASAVREEAGEYLLTATLDIARLAEDPAASWRLAGTAFVGGPSSSMELTRSELVLRIDRTTHLVQEYQTIASLQLTPPAPPEGVSWPEGFAPESFPALEMQVTTQLTISDYNDPAIRIEPPQ